MARWTPAEMEFLRENFDEMTYEEMGDYLGRTPSAICMQAKRHGLTGKMNGHSLKTDEYIFIMDNYETMTSKEIAEVLNRTVSSVENAIKKMRKDEMIGYKYRRGVEND